MNRLRRFVVALGFFALLSPSIAEAHPCDIYINQSIEWGASASFAGAAAQADLIAEDYDGYAQWMSIYSQAFAMMSLYAVQYDNCMMM